MPADEHQDEEHQGDAEDKRARMLAGLLPKRRSIMGLNAAGSRQ